MCVFLILCLENRLMDDKLDKRFAKHTHQMKGYIDSKLADQKGDIIEYIKGKHTQEITGQIDSKMDARFAKHTQEITGHIDSKLADQKGDIISYMKGDREREK